MKNRTFIYFSILLFTACGGDFDELRMEAEAQLAESNAPAVSIAIYKEGEIVFAEAFGTVSSASEIPADKNTLFQLGSTTKMLTALAVLRQVDSGIIGLDEALLDAFPGISVDEETLPGWQEVTIHHLLTHQGGFIPDGGDDEGSLQDVARDTFPILYGQMNPAGRFWNYSNPNWSYLGALLEHKLEDDFANIIERYAFDPLAMSRSTVRYEDALTDGNYSLGTGVIRREGELIEGSAEDLSEIARIDFGVPAGSYTWSTPTEMLKMADFLLNGDEHILSEHSRNKMITPQVDMQVHLPFSYGYGIFVKEGIEIEDSWYPIKLLEHGGQAFTHTSMFWVVPEYDVAVVLLSSANNTDFSKTMLAALESVIELPEPEEVPLKPVAYDLFHKHEGTYYAKQFGQIQITKNDDILNIHIPLFDQVGREYSNTLEPVGASVFLATSDGNRIPLTFIAKEIGGPSVYIRNWDFVAIRSGD